MSFAFPFCTTSFLLPLSPAPSAVLNFFFRWGAWAANLVGAAEEDEEEEDEFCLCPRADAISPLFFPEDRAPPLSLGICPSAFSSDWTVLTFGFRPLLPPFPFPRPPTSIPSSTPESGSGNMSETSIKSSGIDSGAISPCGSSLLLSGSVSLSFKSTSGLLEGSLRSAPSLSSVPGITASSLFLFLSVEGLRPLLRSTPSDFS
mmetsp:Transcript_13175/g.25917  ORF Transcript_13175/g.25917 Transcript_13175/m.25917 type:complete len:203 (+) Transcript_13175:1771-2379(+)